MGQGFDFVGLYYKFRVEKTCCLPNIDCVLLDQEALFALWHYAYHFGALPHLGGFDRIRCLALRGLCKMHRLVQYWFCLSQLPGLKTVLIDTGDGRAEVHPDALRQIVEAKCDAAFDYVPLQCRRSKCVRETRRDLLWAAEQVLSGGRARGFLSRRLCIRWISVLGMRMGL